MNEVFTICNKILKQQFKNIVKDGEKTMKLYAPVPRASWSGLGSEATGATKRGIHIENRGDFKAFVGVANDHANFAEDGRGAISKPTLMRWKDKRGRWHSAYKVAPMQGWHFVRRTAAIMRAKYGK